jgi:methionyl-tRNA formyltransferase
MNVVLVGEESAGLQVLRALRGSGHRLIAVLASPPRTVSPSATVWKAANQLGCQTFPAERVRDPALGDYLRSQEVHILLNVHSLYIVHDDVLIAPQIGAFNLHPGPLPRYAGLNAVSWAIYRGEKEHGATLHKMESQIDAGPIVYQSFFAIDEEETALSLSLKCVRHGVPLVLRLLEAAASGPEGIPLRPQDASRCGYLKAGPPQGGQVVWSSPASEVLNFIRACDYFPFPSPWGHPSTRLGKQEIAIIRARRTGCFCDASPGTVGERREEGVLVACQDQWILVTKVKAGGQYIAATKVLKKGGHLETDAERGPRAIDYLGYTQGCN